MKKYFSVFALLALFSLITLAACQKEEPQPDPANEKGLVWIGLLRQYATCKAGGLFCIRRENVSKSDLAYLTPGEDEAFATPEITPEGHLSLTAEVDVETLSPETRSRLLEEKTLMVDDQFEVPESMVRQAFVNSGKTFDGRRFFVTPGPKTIKHEGSGTSPKTIKITIEWDSKNRTLTITIEF